MPEAVKDVTTQEQSDREFAKSFSAAAKENMLLFALRLRIGVLEQQIEDERVRACWAVGLVAIACTTLGHVL